MQELFFKYLQNNECYLLNTTVGNRTETKKLLFNIKY